MRVISMSVIFMAAFSPRLHSQRITVDGQRKCPAKWPAKMSLVLLAMITDGSYSTRSRFMGGLRASMYFFAVFRWMPSSRATPRTDNPLRFAF